MKENQMMILSLQWSLKCPVRGIRLMASYQSRRGEDIRISLMLLARLQGPIAQCYSGSSQVAKPNAAVSLIYEVSCWTEGVLSMWSTGVLPNMNRAAIITVGQLAAYDECKHALFRFGMKDAIPTISRAIESLIGSNGTSTAAVAGWLTNALLC
eukprot:669942-Amphidinium_carterae.1